MTLFAYAFWVTSFISFLPEIQQTGFNPSNVETLQKHCANNGITVSYEKDGIVIHAKNSINEVFILPIRSKYIWRVYQNQSSKNLFKLSSNVWNKRTGLLKNNHKSEVIIDITKGIIYDTKVSKKYFLFLDKVTEDI